MDDILNEQFGRVEKALTTLVDSIAAYNPSTQAALNLVVADDELSEGLDQLAKHQANHTRIQSLRAEADALEEQLKSSVKKLAELRHQLFDTPATVFPEDSRVVPVDELLQYATNIAKYTVPPTYRERVPVADKDRDKEDEETASSIAPTNGVNTPVAAPETTEPAKEAIEGQKEGEPADGAVPEITPEEEEWLKKLKDSQIAWYPWPSVDKIRAGTLYSLQYWQAKGKNLDEFNIPEHLEAERLKGLPAVEATKEGSPATTDAQQAATLQQWGTSRPQRPTAVFTGFDDMDE